MGEKYVQETQNTLGKIIKKPPMTEKLLTKPPFRFLHDIITQVIKTTGFMKGLYDSFELDSANVKDKERKVAFLQKAIDLVAMVNGQPLSVRPSKIVAGSEPEKTNEFLQALAKACSSKPDSSEEVKRVLNGEKPSSGKPPRPKEEADKKRETSGDKRTRDKDRKDRKGSSDNRNRSSSRDKEKGSKKDRENEKSKDREGSKDRDRSKDRERSKDRDKSKDRERIKDEEKHKDSDKEKDRSKDKSRDKNKERSRDKEKERSKDKERNAEDGARERSKDRDKEKDKDRDKERERRDRKKRREEDDSGKPPPPNDIHNDDEGESDDTEDLRPAATEGEDGFTSNRIPRPSSAKGQRRRPMKDSDDSDTEGDAEPTRKTSAKPLKDEVNGHMNNDDPGQAHVTPSKRPPRPSSARPAPPRLRKKQESVDKDESRVGSGKQVSNVIVDNGQNSEDEDESFVVQDAQPLDDEGPGPMASESVEDDGEHGGLVKKILETKKELEGGNKEDKEEKPVILDAAHRKQRELVQREVEKLRGSIQTLTRSANPLGKIMDYLQEDVDSMQKELEMWRKENQEHELAIKREQSVTDAELEPLHAQLTELDQSIADQLEAIATAKSNILKNEEKINKMVGSVALS